MIQCRTVRLLCLASATLGLMLAIPSSAHAGDPAAAQALFKEALALADQGQWAQACPKFKASFDFDPSVSTLVHIASCSERDGKLATAWGQLAEAQRMNLQAAPSPRRAQLEAHIKKLSDALASRVPRVRVVLSNVDAASTTVTRDGAKLPSGAIGELLPLDPGEHVVTAEAAGFALTEQRFTLTEGQSLDVTLAPTKLEPKVEPPPIAPPPLDPAPGPSGPSRPIPPTSPEDDDAAPSGQAIAGLTLSGIGGAGIVAGAVLAGLAGSKASDIPEGCSQDPYVCATPDQTATANDASDSGSAFLTGSIASFAAGAGVLATGLIVWATAPRSTSAARLQPWVGPGLAGGDLVLRW